MSLSKKIILASSVCVAFLLVGIGCGVEEREVDGKGIFKCMSNDDCLTGSQCVKAKDSDPYGECIREKDIDHCRDNDGDGFYTETSKEYYNECGFSETANPRDPDDSNPLIYPGATERCDGVDNSGDGCVDGIKQEDGSCEQLITPCWGPGKYTEYANSACSAQYIGVTICLDGKLVHGIEQGGKIVKDESGGKCPASPEELKDMTAKNGDHRYNQVSNDLVLQGVGSDLIPDFDNNCDTVYDFTKCTATNAKCVVTGLQYFDAESPYYKTALDACTGEGKSEADCECLGTEVCKDNKIVCGKAEGSEIDKATLVGKSCYTE